MENDKDYIRHVLFFLYKSGKSARASAGQLNEVHESEVVSIRTAQKWFSRFKEGVNCIKDNPRTGRPVSYDESKLAELVENEPHLTIEQLSELQNSSIGTTYRHLKKLGKVSKLGKWVPHKLTENQMEQRTSICLALLSWHQKEPFLDRLITGDEKWILYSNDSRKSQWVDKDQDPIPQVKPDIHQKKVLLCVWWSARGIVHFEILENKETVTAHLYCDQLDRLNQKLIETMPDLINRKGFIFHHDNARPHSAKITQEKLKELKWEILSHPPYSPDLAPSDFYLFLKMQNFLKDKNFRNSTDIKTEMEKFFFNRPSNFYFKGIHKLPERWKKVTELNGNYILD